VLRSPEHRVRFAADLDKMTLRLPVLEEFWAFSKPGRCLAELHVGYETVEPWPLDGLPGTGVSPRELRVEKMRFASKADRSAIVVNPYITLSGIPEEAHLYEVNGRSALEWLIDRYQVRVDKASGIRNDPNTRSDDPRYIVGLVARVVKHTFSKCWILVALRRKPLPTSVKATSSERGLGPL
jgi:predicted helicase